MRGDCFTREPADHKYLKILNVLFTVIIPCLIHVVVNPTGDEVKVLNEISRKEGSEENSEANQKPSDTEILNPQS